jgi:hypothetical protein
MALSLGEEPVDSVEEAGDDSEGDEALFEP